MPPSCAYDASGRYACMGGPIIEPFFVAPFPSPHAVQQTDLADAVDAATQATYLAQVSTYVIGQAKTTSSAAGAQIGQQEAEWSALSTQQAGVVAQSQAQAEADAQAQARAQAQADAQASAQAQAQARAQAMALAAAQGGAYVPASA